MHDVSLTISIGLCAMESYPRQVLVYCDENEKEPFTDWMD